MTYQEYKAEIEARYGRAEYATPEKEANQSAKMLLEFKAKQARLAKVQIEAVVNDKVDQVKDIELPESKLLDRDLKGFNAIEKDILRAYFANRSLKASQLASQFNKSYQFVAGFLKSNKVQLLINRYFKEDLSESTQLALLKLVHKNDPRAVLASAEFLGVMSKQNIEDNEFKSSEIEADEYTKDCLTKLADWLVDPKQTTLTFTKPLDH